MAALETNIRRVLDILVPQINAHKQKADSPAILGISGLQGSGKSTWANGIVRLLQEQYSLRAITVSLDDFYKTHDHLISQREKDPRNKLYRTRGQPGTHDEQLAQAFFLEVKNRDNQHELKIPSFDKSKFNGEGDRAPIAEWPAVTGNVDVVVFEGWCVGFQAISEADVRAKQESAKSKAVENDPEPINTLTEHQLSHLIELNQNLQRYNDTFMGTHQFDFFLHIDTNDLRNVYRWRLQQEHALIKAKGSGMTDEAVVAFVRGYMPGYELYLDGLRAGSSETQHGHHIRVVLDRDRNVDAVTVL